MLSPGRVACLLAFAVLLPTERGGTDQEELTGRQIMEKARTVNTPANEVMKADMLLTAHGGRTVRRRFRMEYLKHGTWQDCTLIRFSYPRRMKGTGLLTLEQRGRSDDQWLYLPSLRRVRRIAADAKTERFVQSDFTYEDLQPEDLEDNTYKLLRRQEVDGRPCYLVEAVPRSASGYARREIAVDAERWLPLRTRFYDDEGREVKTQTCSVVKSYGGSFWRPDRVEMVDHERRHTTVFAVQAREINRGIDREHFTPRFLRSGR